MAMGKRSTLAAAGDRLDRMVQNIKRQQYEETGLRRIPLSPQNSPEPQTDWARRSVWTLKPQRERVKATDIGAVVPPVAGRPQKPIFQEALDTAPLGAGSDAPKEGHIGSALGKPGPRRGLFNRLFRRDN